MPRLVGNVYSPRAALMPNLRNEEQRLKTFHNWTSVIMTPGELAANGFYYTGYHDVVRCVFCCVVIGDWEEGDRASVGHEMYCPDCDFVKVLWCGNIPKTATRPLPCFWDVQQFRVGPYAFARIDEDTNRLRSELRNMGVTPTVGPRRPYLASTAARLHTFRNMETYRPIPPQLLAAAGFYSDGFNENYCFYCGGGLLDWAPNDDPLLEHARYYPQCAFVNIVKGQDFVMRTRQRQSSIPGEAPYNIFARSAGQNEAAALPLQMAAMRLDEKDEDSEPENVQVQGAERCIVCMREERSIVFLPCRHLVICATCAPGLSWCPFCMKIIEGIVRVYF